MYDGEIVILRINNILTIAILRLAAWMPTHRSVDHSHHLLIIHLANKGEHCLTLHWLSDSFITCRIVRSEDAPPHVNIDLEDIGTVVDEFGEDFGRLVPDTGFNKSLKEHEACRDSNMTSINRTRRFQLQRFGLRPYHSRQYQHC